MLKERILSTLRFFDLQDWPVTLFELHQYLLLEPDKIRNLIDDKGELLPISAGFNPRTLVTISQVLDCLDNECRQETGNLYGFYFLTGRSKIAQARLDNYYYGIRREKLIRRFAGFLKFLPFVRGVGLVGSQAMGQQKKASDIDLFILTDPRFLWLARFFVSAYFQVLGKRRHGKKIANRFCLNHYVANNKELNFDRNLYTALEYLKMRPLVFEENILKFQDRNKDWIGLFFQQPEFITKGESPQPKTQRYLEKLLSNKFGDFLEKVLKKIQYSRLDLGDFILATDDELSFHPQNRKQELFSKFFKFQQQNHREAV